jgi:hypothetical protein
MSFAFSSLSHYFATAFSDLHKAEKFILAEAPKVSVLEPVVEGVSAALLGPQSVVIERAAFSALGYVLSLTNQLINGQADVQTAATSKLTNLGLDLTAINDFKALITNAKGDLAKLGYTV